jgi:predicted lipoprotein with Yx(FWY)xxD motif
MATFPTRKRRTLSAGQGEGRVSVTPAYSISARAVLFELLWEDVMKTWFLALGLVAASTFGAFAAEPAKMADTSAGKILVTPKGMTLYTLHD